ncbi:MAG: hypothetical protein Q7T82_04515 [Armatimonadota bacterium]|nr:hypothetical protein [Armatimonadota bacterium]
MIALVFLLVAGVFYYVGLSRRADQPPPLPTSNMPGLPTAPNSSPPAKTPNTPPAPAPGPGG